MPITVKITIDTSGVDLSALSDAERDFTDFHKKVNALVLQRGLQRLNAKATRSPIRTGRLTSSLLPGGRDQINRVGQSFGEVGSSVEYARKVQEGGRIFPRDAKALAVPVTERTKRSLLSPRDVDPGRKRLEFVPRKGKPPLLIDIENKLMWVLLPSVDWGPGYEYLGFDEKDLRDVEEIFFKHIGLER